MPLKSTLPPELKYWLKVRRDARTALVDANAQWLVLTDGVRRARQERRWGDIGFLERALREIDRPRQALLATIDVAEHQLIRRCVEWDIHTGKMTQFGRVVA